MVETCAQTKQDKANKALKVTDVASLDITTTNFKTLQAEYD